MNEDTINLLKECSAGCKMASNSIEQLLPYIRDQGLKDLIYDYDSKHFEIGNECYMLLSKDNMEEKDPGMITKAMSWINTEMKMMIHENSHNIASVMIDGCNSGIKTISEYINNYKTASDESISIAKRFIKMEQEFMNDLLNYL